MVSVGSVRYQLTRERRRELPPAPEVAELLRSRHSVDLALAVYSPGYDLPLAFPR